MFDLLPAILFTLIFATPILIWASFTANNDPFTLFTIAICLHVSDNYFDIHKLNKLEERLDKIEAVEKERTGVTND